MVTVRSYGSMDRDLLKKSVAGSLIIGALVVGNSIMFLVFLVIDSLLFVLLLIPRLGYFGVIICEPAIWIVMTLQLALAYRGNRYMSRSA